VYLQKEQLDKMERADMLNAFAQAVKPRAAINLLLQQQMVFHVHRNNKIQQ
jgi:hypothetical protein